MRQPEFRLITMRAILGLLMVLFIPMNTVHAKPPVPTWDHCLQQEAQSLDIPIGLFRAIIYSESRNHPYAIGWTDATGQRHSVFPETQQEAKKVMFALLQQNQKFDSGLGQVSTIHLARVSHPSELLIPCTNLRVSRQVLQENLDRHGYTWLAIAGYNGSIGSTKYIELVHNNLCRHSPDLCSAEKPFAQHTPKPTDPLPTHRPHVVMIAEPSAPQTALSDALPANEYEDELSLRREHMPPAYELSPENSAGAFLDTLERALPDSVRTFTLCLQILLPFLIFLGSLLLFCYGIRICCWAIGLAFESLRALLRGLRPPFPILTAPWTRQPVHVTANRPIHERM